MYFSKTQMCVGAVIAVENTEALAICKIPQCLNLLHSRVFKPRFRPSEGGRKLPWLCTILWVTFLLKKSNIKNIYGCSFFLRSKSKLNQIDPLISVQIAVR